MTRRSLFRGLGLAATISATLILPAATAAQGPGIPEILPVLAAPVHYPAVPLTARGSYTVKKGGRLATVARRTGTTLESLATLNPELSRDAVLPAGTRVRLPVPGSW